MNRFNYRHTRFKELGYANFGPGHWQFVDLTSTKIDGSWAQIGAIYPTRLELLADVDRFYRLRFTSGEVIKPDQMERLIPEVLDVLNSIVGHSKEFGDIEDSEMMVERIGTKARALLAKLEDK